MNIIKRELRSHIKSLIIWSVSLIIFIAMMVSEFSAYYNNEEMADILDAMPKALMDALSMSGTNITTVIGFISMASVYFFLALGIYSGLLGSAIISREERDKTAEFLFVLPVSRVQTIMSKLIAAVILSLTLNLVLAGSIIGNMAQYDKGEGFNEFIGFLMLAIFITQMIFLSIGMFLASVIKHYKLSGKISMGVLFGLYMVSIFSALSDKLENLKYLTPFKYFEATVIAQELSLEPKYIILSIVIIVGALIGTFLVYPRRDLHI
jgi:ABC-2 type transport system permease protein